MYPVLSLHKQNFFSLSSSDYFGGQTGHIIISSAHLRVFFNVVAFALYLPFDGIALDSCVLCLRPNASLYDNRIKEGGIKQPKIESCGRTWGRPMSNKGLSKADDDDDDDIWRGPYRGRTGKCKVS